MKLILKESVERLGEPGDVVKVKPGYARNYLLPRGLAYEASTANIRRLEEEHRRAEERARRAYLEARRRAARLEGMHLVFRARAGESEKLFGSVTAADIADRAVNFIGEHADDDAPFFLYVPFGAPHTPTQAKEEDLPLYDRLSAIEPPRSWEEATGHNPLMPLEERTTLRRVHAAMVHALDVGIGRILDALDTHGIADNTLLLFFSDNGGSVGIGDNGPFRGCKATVYEGGIRVAAAARWPAASVSGGRDVTVPLAYIDVLPTLMRVAGIDDHGGKPLDGVDVLDVLTGEQDALERDLYSFVGRTKVRDQVAVSEGDWKLVVIGPHLTEEGAAEASMRQLFRLDEDPLERHDVAADHPDIVARLTEKAIAFRALQPPNPVPLYSEGEGTFVPPPNWQFGVE